MRRLKAVNLRDRARQDNAYSIRHIIFFKRVRDLLLHNFSCALNNSMHFRAAYMPLRTRFFHIFSAPKL